MRPSRFFAVIAVLLAAFPIAAVAGERHVGAKITVAEATPIATIVGKPDDYAGKVVRVEGEVRGVCMAAGCWMDVGDASGNRIRIKVDDGVLVFPADAVGNSAVAQGTVVVKEMTREKYVEWQRHLAEERGEPFDESKLGAGPFRVVELSGTGADIGG
jgi:hypothetical protein